MTKKKIVFSILSIVLALTLVAGVYAWFYMNESTYVDYGSDIVCEAGKSLEISADNGNSWDGVISLTGFSSEMQDITGDGVNLYYPTKMDDYNQPVSYDVATVYNSTTKEGDYVELTLRFRSTSAMDVYLSGESFVSPANPDKTGNIFGDFSRDYIAGATRVAFIENGTTKMVWAPNPEYQLTRNENGAYHFTTAGTPETYYFTDTNHAVQPYTAEDYATSRFVTGSTGADVDTTGKSARLFSIRPSADDYGYADLTVRVWFEGTDREACHALAGGQVKVKLKFTGIDKSEVSTAQQQTLNAVSYSGGSVRGYLEGMSLSTDGKTWTDYPALPDLNGCTQAFVRYKETASHFASAVKAITIS